MALNFENDTRNQKTEDAMSNPQVGDRFTEMYAFWVYVIGREGNYVTIMEANPPCTLPDDGKMVTLTLLNFRKRYAYGSGVKGYSVCFVDGNNDVSGWMKDRKQKEVETIYDYQI